MELPKFLLEEFSSVTDYSVKTNNNIGGTPMCVAIHFTIHMCGLKGMVSKSEHSGIWRSKKGIF